MKMLKKLIALAAAGVMTAALLTGCSNGTEASGEAKESGKDAPVMGVTFRDTTNQTYKSEIDAMQEKCDEYGIEMIVQDAAEDIQTQISQIENFMAMDVDYIFVNVFDADGIADTIQKAKDAGFFVIIYDATFDNVDMTFGYIDNYEYGYKVGEMAADYINSTPALANAETVEWGLQTYTVVSDIIARGEGVKAAMEELAPNAKLVAEQDVLSTEAGVTATENFIQAHPDIKIVCGISDPFVYGAYQAFQADGRTGEEYGVFGCDGSAQALELVGKDTIYRGTVALPLEEGARELIDTLWKQWNGEEVDDKIPFEMIPVTADNYDEYMSDK